MPENDSPQAQPPERIWLPKRALYHSEPPHGANVGDGTWYVREDLPRAAADSARWDKSGLKEACQRALAIGRTHQEIDIQLMLDMLMEIERLESTSRAECGSE